MKQGGLIRTGKPVWSPKVATVNVTANPYSAQIQDCYDSTSWSTVDKATGKSVDMPGQVKRRTITAEVMRYDDGRWLVYKVTPGEGGSC